VNLTTDLHLVPSLRMPGSFFCNKSIQSGIFPTQLKYSVGKTVFKKGDRNNTRSVRKVSDRIFLCEHLTDYNLARLHEPTLNLSAHA
jgi:hypothetical protein